MLQVKPVADFRKDRTHLRICVGQCVALILLQRRGLRPVQHDCVGVGPEIGGHNALLLFWGVRVVHGLGPIGETGPVLTHSIGREESVRTYVLRTRHQLLPPRLPPVGPSSSSSLRLGGIEGGQQSTGQMVWVAAVDQPFYCITCGLAM